MLSEGTRTFSWEHGRQLKAISTDEEAWTYTYDANGLRTGRSTGTTQNDHTYTYYYNGSQLSYMLYDNILLQFTYSASGVPLSVTTSLTDRAEEDACYYYVTNIQGDVIAILNHAGYEVVTYSYDAWGNILSVGGTLASTLGAYNPLRYRGYVYDQETGLYYLQSRYYNPEIGRFINADNNFSNNNLYLYCANNPVNAADPGGEHWYYLWIDDFIDGVKELMASVSNLVYGQAAYERQFYDPAGAWELYNSRPFQEVKPSTEMQIFTGFMYNHDFVADISVSISTPIENTYIKFGGSKVLSANKNINASYVHVGGGVSTPSALPITISYSVGIVNGVNTKGDYAGSFYDTGTVAMLGFDYCWWDQGASAYSFTISNSYGVYYGYDYYWCVD